jgi:tetratricopeptide (TPR) repeat protein
LYALGRIYYQQNRFPEAVRQFQQVIEQDPVFQLSDGWKRFIQNKNVLT